MAGLQPYLNYALCFVCALVVVWFSIPNIIYVASRKRLFDVPDNSRKLHTRVVPNLGGVGIFLAYIIVTSLFIGPAVLQKWSVPALTEKWNVFERWNYIAAACLILFVTGLKDDLVSISPSKKFLAQFAAAFITVYFAGVRLESLGGLFGVYTLEQPVSIIFSIIGCMFVTNAFNLVDGVDGLAGSVGVMASLFFGGLMASAGNVSASLVAFSLAGAICGFLRYNISPARIFMGDTGSMLIGFVLSILAILFVNTYAPSSGFTPQHNWLHGSDGALMMALSILFLPIFDTFRVFGTRILKGYSPFRADRTHFHHYLLDLGFTHNGTVLTIVGSNLLIIATCFVMQGKSVHLCLLLLLLIAAGLFSLVFFVRRERVIKPAQVLNGHVAVMPRVKGVKVAKIPAATVSESMNLTANGVPLHIEPMVSTED